MCGISGVFSVSKTFDYSAAMARSLLSMNHRGPDSKGVYYSPCNTVTLGHARLSIHDLSVAGTQPMHFSTVNDDYTIVFNGEIYNFIEVKKELIDLGYTFKTQTDTEVLLTAYAAWGENCLSRLNGMFAFAVFEKRSKRLFIARDRVGEKPLYYFVSDSGELVFGSELKALLPLIMLIQPSYAKSELLPSIDVVHAYMQKGYMTGEDTIYPGVKKLPPGYAMYISDKGITKSPYWSLVFPNKKIDITPTDAIAVSKDLFRKSLSIRLRADVDVGVFLSGGLDSSVVVAGLVEQGVSLNTYSVNYDRSVFGVHFDESEHAKKVASHFKVPYSDITLSAKNFLDTIPTFIEMMEEPVAEAAAISLFMLSKIASKEVKVVLSGEGSDELFAGYQIYERMRVMEKFRSFFGENVSKALSLASKAYSQGNKLRKYGEMLGKPLHKRYRGVSTADMSTILSLYKDPGHLVNSLKSSDESYYARLFENIQHASVLDKMLYVDTKTWLVDDLLIKADRMTMANSQELRCPFLDHDLIDFAARLPDHFKLRNGDVKWLVKQWYKDSLPPSVLKREKVGFPTPLKAMFSGVLRDYARTKLLSRDTVIHRYFDNGKLQKLLDDHTQGKADHHMVIWQLIVLEGALRNMLDLVSEFSGLDSIAA